MPEGSIVFGTFVLNEVFWISFEDPESNPVCLYYNKNNIIQKSCPKRGIWAKDQNPFLKNSHNKDILKAMCHSVVYSDAHLNYLTF